jgi:hypothetical protein
LLIEIIIEIELLREYLGIIEKYIYYLIRTPLEISKYKKRAKKKVGDK